MFLSKKSAYLTIRNIFYGTPCTYKFILFLFFIWNILFIDVKSFMLSYLSQTLFSKIIFNIKTENIMSVPVSGPMNPRKCRFVAQWAYQLQIKILLEYSTCDKVLVLLKNATAITDITTTKLILTLYYFIEINETKVT